MCSYHIEPLVTLSLSKQHSWKWFIYHRCQNQNRGSGAADGAEPVRKRCKIEKTNKHPYPTVPPSTAEDEISCD